MEAEANTRAEPVSYSDHGAESDTETDQLDWDPERMNDDGYPLVDENWSTSVLVPPDGPLDESAARSLTAGAQGYREVHTNLRDSVTGGGQRKPASGRYTKGVRKTLLGKKTKRDRNVRTRSRTKRKNTVPSASQEQN